jgi:hypothetical protein
MTYTRMQKKTRLMRKKLKKCKKGKKCAKNASFFKRKFEKMRKNAVSAKNAKVMCTLMQTNINPSTTIQAATRSHFQDFQNFTVNFQFSDCILQRLFEN